MRPSCQISLWIMAVAVLPSLLLADRAARPMTLEFFQRMIYSAYSLDGDATGSTTEAEWQQHTESNWVRAIQLDQNESKSYPFYICDDNTTSASADRKLNVVAAAIGFDPDTADLEDYLTTVYNEPEITCYIGSFNGTRAGDLGGFILQPLSFLMKINSGSMGFTDFEDGDVLQYAIYFCPGMGNSTNLTRFALDALDTAVPVIHQLVLVPEAAAYRDNLLALQSVLDTQPDFCDDLLVNNVQSELGGAEYAILTLNSAKVGVAPETCFLLLTFALAFAPETCYIERREALRTKNDEAQWISQSGVTGDTPFFDVGISGEGQVVAVSDTGLDMDNCYFRDVSPVMFGTGSDPGRRKVVQYVDYVNAGEVVNGHGTHVCGTIAGRKSEDGVNDQDGLVDGVAKNAKLAFFDIGFDDAQGRLSVPGASTLLQPGKDAGARIHSASWGSSSTFYTSQARDFDEFLFSDDSFLLVIAAGNSGPDAGTVGSPASSKNVLSVGASTSAGSSISGGTTPVDDLATFSSVGPTMDQRVKPDIVAPGAYVLSAGARVEPSCDPPNQGGLPGPGQSGSINYGVTSKQGTSMATPVIAGSAALVRQYFMEGWDGDGSKGSSSGFVPTGVLVKAVLINGAQPLAGYALNEVDVRQGFGRLSLIDSLPLAGKNDLLGAFLDSESIRQGETNTYTFVLEVGDTTCDDAELSATIAWMDLPGPLGCLDCLMNDLDLFVVQTTATGEKIEHFPNGRTEKDRVNNVERVRFKAADGDSFVVTVKAAHLEGLSQKYAISTVYGCLNHRLRSGEGSSSANHRSFALSFVAFAALLAFF